MASALRTLRGLLTSSVALQVIVPFAAVTLVTGLVVTFTMSAAEASAAGAQLQLLQAREEDGATTAFAGLQERELAQLRLASDTQGVGEAVARQDVPALVSLLLPINANELPLQPTTVVLRADGATLVTIRPDPRRPSECVCARGAGSGYPSYGPVARVLGGKVDRLGAKYAGLGSIGGTDEFYVVGPVLQGSRRVGAIIYGLPVSYLASSIASSEGGVAIFDLQARQLAANPSGLDGFDQASVRRAAAHGVQRRSESRGGRQEWVFYVPLQARDETLGTVALTLPAGSVATASSLRPILVLVSALGVLLTLLAGFYVSRRFSTRLGRLIDSTKRVGEGNLSHRAEVDSRDEIGQLSASFNQMTEKLESDRELERERDTASAAARAKAEFLATMSHEIRTPLNAVIGLSELVADGELGDQEREYMRTIRASADHLLTVINDILDYSKFEAGRLELESIDFDPVAAVEESLELVGVLAGRKGIDLAYAIRPGTPRWVAGDPGRLRQVFVNLLSNAVKFTASGDVRVTIGPASAGGGGIEFEVVDSGIGIPADQVDRLFRSFSQVDSSTSRRYGGTGLGLAICKFICEAMGGSIGVESTLGAGSRFFGEVRVAAPAGAAPAGPALGLDLDGGRILVIDNSPAIADQVRQWAAAQGADVQCAGSSAEALAFVETGARIDLVLLDQHLDSPEGGLAIADRIDAMRGRGSLPILLMPYVGESIDPGRVRAVGARGALQKPLTEQRLADVVTAAVAGLERGDVRTETPPLAELHPLRLLLVEDNQVNQKVATVMLGKLGYSVEIARNGLEAVAAVEQSAYDLVFMDMHMPEMNGLDATREIVRRWPDTRPVIVAMTAAAIDDERQACLQAGMDDYLSKPVKLEELTRMLTKWAAGRHAEAV